MNQLTTDLTKDVNIQYPIIMAPMFLVSNKAMITAAMDAGIMGCFPTLNYRKEGELEQLLEELNAYAPGKSGSYGVNLIVQKSNVLYQKHLKACEAAKVPFFITSLGSPEEVIETAHRYGGKVYCDVTNLKHAQKCYDLGCDGFVAVGQGAGGHAGPYPLQLLVPTLRKHFPDKPVVSAGGIAHGEGIASVLALGSAGVSVGTRFIATEEATVSDAYKNAIVDSGMEDIVLTERLSGTPCNIIDTPYAKKIGYKQNWFERFMQKNKKIKKYFKLLIAVKGMKKLENSVKPGSYKNLWCAGQSVEMVDSIASVQHIVDDLMAETHQSIATLTALQNASQSAVPAG